MHTTSLERVLTHSWCESLMQRHMDWFVIWKFDPHDKSQRDQADTAMLHLTRWFGTKVIQHHDFSATGGKSLLLVDASDLPATETAEWIASRLHQGDHMDDILAFLSHPYADEAQTVWRRFSLLERIELLTRNNDDIAIALQGQLPTRELSHATIEHLARQA